MVKPFTGSYGKNINCIKLNKTQYKILDYLSKKVSLWFRNPSLLNPAVRMFVR